MRKAIAVARAKGRKVALTLSDVFCVNNHRADWKALLASHVDLMFGNEHEVCALYETQSLDAAMEELAKHACIAVVTRSGEGAVVLEGGRRHVVAGETRGERGRYHRGWRHVRWRLHGGVGAGPALVDCARMGNIAAAEIITHYGARAEADLKALVKAKLG